MDAQVNETLNGFGLVHTVLLEPAVEVGGHRLKAGHPTIKPAFILACQFPGRPDPMG